MAGWHDFTQKFDANIFYPAHFPPPSFESVDGAGVKPEVTKVSIVTHMGTHLDAPSHFISDSKTITDIPLERLTGEAVVWHVPAVADEAITVETLESMQPQPRAGDAVIIHTGWHSRFYDESYREHPYLSTEAAEWLVAKGVHLVGMDLMSPDLPGRLRPPGYDMPAHHVLLGNDVLIIENVGDASALAGHRVELIVGAIPFTGLDGAPIRLLARAID
jgi:kynurenine formamidase